MKKLKFLRLRSGQAFTLIELLVAATIFVAVTVIVTATLSQLVKMQKRILYRRQVNQAVRLGVERITRIIQEGTAKGKIDGNSIYGVAGFKKCDTPNYSLVANNESADLIIAIAPDPETDGYLVRLLKVADNGRNIWEAEFTDDDGTVTTSQLNDVNNAVSLFPDNVQLTGQNSFAINGCGQIIQTIFRFQKNGNTNAFEIQGEIENKALSDVKLQFKTFATSRYRE